MSIDFFGTRLKAVRKSKDFTQLELANRLEVSKGTVSAYEQGLSLPSLETLTRICDILNTSADYLLGITDQLSYRMGGLTEQQTNSVLQFIALIEKANQIINKSRLE